jgi:hypothetical protein
MSSSIYGTTQKQLTSFWTEVAQSFWNRDDKKSRESSNALQLLGQQQADMVSMSLKGVGDRLTEDLAILTADYLVDKPELDDEYALVIVNTAQGREARAYRRSDLVADLPADKREKVLAALEKNPLMYHDTAEGLPPVSDDPALAGLAETVQKFLDKNEKVLNILVRENVLSWAAE